MSDITITPSQEVVSVYAKGVSLVNRRVSLKSIKLEQVRICRWL